MVQSIKYRKGEYMVCTIEKYLELKKHTHLEDYEVRILGVEQAGDNLQCAIEVHQLKDLYSFVLVNINLDKRYLRTVFVIEKLTKDNLLFKQMRNTIGSPTRRYWGMSKLRIM